MNKLEDPRGRWLVFVQAYWKVRECTGAARYCRLKEELGWEDLDEWLIQWWREGRIHLELGCPIEGEEERLEYNGLKYRWVVLG